MMSTNVVCSCDVDDGIYQLGKCKHKLQSRLAFSAGGEMRSADIVVGNINIFQCPLLKVLCLLLHLLVLLPDTCT